MVDSDRPQTSAVFYSLSRDSTKQTLPDQLSLQDDPASRHSLVALLFACVVSSETQPSNPNSAVLVCCIP